jgi:RNA polymerase sigma factor (sigma-70 family)
VTLKELLGVQAAKVKRLAAWSRFLERRAERAQVELIELYEPMVGYMSWRDYGTRGDLEDIKANGMLGVFEATQKIDVKRVKDVDAYVSMVARSRMINYVQKRAMKPPDVIVQDEKIEQMIEEQMEGDADLSIDISEGMMESIPAKERLVLKLRFWGGWHQKEIAELLKCSTPNVWYIEKQALAHLDSACYTPGVMFYKRFLVFRGNQYYPAGGFAMISRVRSILSMKQLNRFLRSTINGERSLI